MRGRTMAIDLDKSDDFADRSACLVNYRGVVVRNTVDRLDDCSLSEVQDLVYREHAKTS
jgi:hypothetical protein